MLRCGCLLFLCVNMQQGFVLLLFVFLKTQAILLFFGLYEIIFSGTYLGRMYT